jgi:hypothetical protein
MDTNMINKGTRDEILSEINLVNWFMMFNATFNNISVIQWWSVLLVEEAGDNRRPVVSH